MLRGMSTGRVRNMSFFPQSLVRFQNPESGSLKISKIRVHRLDPSPRHFLALFYHPLVGSQALQGMSTGAREKVSFFGQRLASSPLGVVMCLCVGTCGPTSAPALARRTDTADNGSESVSQNADTAHLRRADWE